MSIFTELHGGLLREQAGWRVVFERFDSGTDSLSIVLRNDEMKLLKAHLYVRFDDGVHTQPVWDAISCAETPFALKDLPKAVRYLESLVASLDGPDSDP